MSDSFYSFSDPLNSGIDFYTKDEGNFIRETLSGSVDLSVKLTFNPGLISSNISANSNASITVAKIAFASTSIVIDGATLTLGTRIKPALAVLSGSANLSVSASRIATAAASISSNSNLTVSTQEFLNAQINISCTSSVSVSAVKQAKAIALISATSNLQAIGQRFATVSAILSGNVNLTIVGKISLATARIVIGNIANITARAIKFISGSVSTTSDLSDIRTMLLIDDKPITNHNRKLDMSVEPVFIENVNWNNRKSRYYKSSARPARRTFNLSWTYVPNSQSHTVDGKRGRDYIREIAGKPQHHILKIINMDENGTTPYTETSYNVLVKDYNETLIRRDLVDDIYFFDCSISLEEV